MARKRRTIEFDGRARIPDGDFSDEAMESDEFENEADLEGEDEEDEEDEEEDGDNLMKRKPKPQYAIGKPAGRWVKPRGPRGPLDIGPR